MALCSSQLPGALLGVHSHTHDFSRGGKSYGAPALLYPDTEGLGCQNCFLLPSSMGSIPLPCDSFAVKPGKISSADMRMIVTYFMQYICFHAAMSVYKYVCKINSEIRNCCFHFHSLSNVFPVLILQKHYFKRKLNVYILNCLEKFKIVFKLLSHVSYFIVFHCQKLQSLA